MTPSCGPFKLSPVFLVAFAVVFQLTSLCLLLLTPATSADPRRYHDYCIVGAGPAGLQLGHYMQKANRDYVIFERSNVSGKPQSEVEKRCIFFIFMPWLPLGDIIH